MPNPVRMLSRLLIATVFVVAPSPGNVRADVTSQAQAQDSTPAPRVVEVIARRYTFEPAVIEAAAGERLRLLIRSADGPHGFQIKEFKVSKELERGGAPVAVEFTAETEGTFPILCSLYCGDGHADMKGSLVIKAREATP